MRLYQIRTSKAAELAEFFDRALDLEWRGVGMGVEGDLLTFEGAVLAELRRFGPDSDGHVDEGPDGLRMWIGGFPHDIEATQEGGNHDQS